MRLGRSCVFPYAESIGIPEWVPVCPQTWLPISYGETRKNMSENNLSVASVRCCSHEGTKARGREHFAVCTYQPAGRLTGICVCDVEMYTLVRWMVSGQNVLGVSFRASHPISTRDHCLFVGGAHCAGDVESMWGSWHEQRSNVELIERDRSLSANADFVNQLGSNVGQ